MKDRKFVKWQLVSVPAPEVVADNWPSEFIGTVVQFHAHNDDWMVSVKHDDGEVYNIMQDRLLDATPTLETKPSASDTTQPSSQKERIGQQIVVPDPRQDGSDLWNHSFEGRIVGFKPESAHPQSPWLVTVEDADGNCFDVEESRLTLAE